MLFACENTSLDPNPQPPDTTGKQNLNTGGKTPVTDDKTSESEDDTSGTEDGTQGQIPGTDDKTSESEDHTSDTEDGTQGQIPGTDDKTSGANGQATDPFVRYAPQAFEHIPADFENNLWLQYHFKELKIDETAMIYPRRVPEVISTPIANDLYYPHFNFEIVAGKGVISITDEDILAENSNGGNPGAKINPATVTALKAGIAIVKVTYDEVTHPNPKAKPSKFGAISEVNTGYIAFSVVDDVDTGISISFDTNKLRYPYEKVYFEGSGKDWPVTITAENATEIEVVCNGEVVSGSGTYILPLKNTQNIIGVKATNAKGESRYHYEMINARKIEINLKPAVPRAGEKIEISFKGITLPVYKLATIYNPALGSNATVVRYTSSGKTYTGKSPQYQLATNNTITITGGLTAGTHTFTNGEIPQSWFGEVLDTEKKWNLPGDQNLNAITRKDVFIGLPDFTVTVEQ